MDILASIQIPEEITDINKKIFSSSSITITKIISNWPNIIIALGIVFIGWLIMKFVNFSMIKISSKIPLYKLSEKSGFTHFLQKAQVKTPPHEVIANFLGGYVFTMFFLAASKILGLIAISEFLDKIIKYIPQVIVALFIVLIGFQFSKTVGAIVESTLNVLTPDAAKIIAHVAKGIIIIFAILTALIQLNIAEELVKILFIGTVSMITLSGGLAIGLGSKDFVREILDSMKKQKK